MERRGHEVGKKVGLSEAAVRQRVQKLTDSGVMQVVAVTDPTQLGFTRQAMIGVRCGGDTREIAEKLTAMPEVDYVVLTAGSFDILPVGRRVVRIILPCQICSVLLLLYLTTPLVMQF